MEELTKTYAEFKKEFDKEMLAVANGFCKIGYLLRIARDTSILHDSVYNNINDFAKAEYGLSKDMVSRYIRINEKYSEGGYSENLVTGYERFGVAKLSEMLTLPDAVADNIVPEMTKEQIQEVRKEVREESKISDIEVALEETEVAPVQLESNIEKFIYEYFKEHKEQFGRVHMLIHKVSGNRFFDIKDLSTYLEKELAPSGVAMLSARVKGIGKIMLSIKGEDEIPTIIYTRTNETENLAWNRFLIFFEKIYGDYRMKVDTAWENAYGTEWQEVAPEQPADKPLDKEKTEFETKTDSENIEQKDSTESTQHEKPIEEKVASKDVAENVDKYEDIVNNMNPPVAVEEDDEAETDADAPIEGQREIHNYAEVLPEGEIFRPVFGEWVSAKKKPCPDEPGNYIAYVKDYTSDRKRQSLMAVIADDEGVIRWTFGADRVLCWMPLPEDPSPEDCE